MGFQKNTNEFPVLSEPACRHLRSKGMYVSGVMDPKSEDAYGMGDGYCWCQLTSGQMGPDNGVVDRPMCSSARPCYESMG